VREYQGVKMSWVTLDRIVSEEILRDDDIRRRAHRGRLADICGRSGRPDEAGEFRRRAEKDRQDAGRQVTRATARPAPTAPAGLAWPCGSRPFISTIGCHASEPDEP